MQINSITDFSLFCPMPENALLNIGVIVFPIPGFKVLHEGVVNILMAATCLRSYNSTGDFDSLRVSTSTV